MKSTTSLPKLIGGVVLVVIGVAIGARLSRPPVGSDIARGDAPLYKIAVDESIKGLLKKKDDKDAANDKVCPDCGKIHTAPAVAPGTPCPDCGKVHTAPAVAPGTPCPDCGKVHAAPHAHAHAGSEGNKDYVYCENCKVYHRRKGAVGADLVPAAVAEEPVEAGPP